MIERCNVASKFSTSVIAMLVLQNIISMITDLHGLQKQVYPTLFGGVVSLLRDVTRLQYPSGVSVKRGRGASATPRDNTPRDCFNYSTHAPSISLPLLQQGHRGQRCCCFPDKTRLLSTTSSSILGRFSSQRQRHGA